MKGTTRFTALRPHPEDDAGTSIELLDMKHHHSRPNSPSRTDSQNWKQDDPNRKLTFWRKFETFPWQVFLAISCLPFALAPLLALAGAAEEASTSYIRKRECYPNGSWKESKGATWRIMDSSYFFTPNLSFGAMTFTQAKVIDIAWDVIVGRGGQLFLAWVNYRVFNEWLLYHMEMHLTSYKMYKAVAFETTSLATMGVFGKEFLAYGERSRTRFFRWLAMLSMLIATFYVLSFPTLMAAMTGYITTYKAYVQDFDNNLIAWDKFSPVTCIVEDAHRIGYEKPLVATRKDKELSYAIYDYIGNYTTREEFSPYTYTDGFGPPESIAWMFKEYLGHEPVTFQRNQSSVFNFEGKSQSLDAPTLNITFLNNITVLDRPSLGLFKFFYAHEGRQGSIYNTSYIFTNGSCKPGEMYQWGFSYIFLFMVSIFNFVWSCIVVCMWIETRRGSRMYKSGRRPGLLRSILDFSAVMREEIGEGEDRLQEEELRKRLRDSGGRLLVPKSELRVARTGGGDAVRKRNWRQNLTQGSTF
ncbi:hypothetical protein BDV95DRAFT_610605 [Massariosphaeria phaeospora]|uniref:Uncharacterized protein n=1 Tax=Massariosphaeria phaeospora TaxID=100035 RepID=A0A7C8M4P2_9PLEO|nr:hypothetical protein BDV95DRAFT_610605 [Massariosphaeria phaeospora]